MKDEKHNSGVTEMGSSVLKMSVGSGLQYVSSRFAGCGRKNEHHANWPKNQDQAETCPPRHQKSVCGVWNCIGETIQSLSRNLEDNGDINGEQVNIVSALHCGGDKGRDNKLVNNPQRIFAWH